MPSAFSFIDRGQRAAEDEAMNHPAAPLRNTRRRLCSAVLSASLLLGGCGGGGGDLDLDDPLLLFILINDIALTLVAGQSAPFLGSDTIGGLPLDLFTNVTFTLIDTTPDGVTVNNGFISVSSSARSGTTKIRFRICQTDRPGNCATGAINLTVPPGG